ALGDRPEHRRAVERVRGSTPERVVHGAQFVTEIQGGSDVPANDMTAVPDGEIYRLHGQKWFCSNINADYFVVTARPQGAPEGGRGVALFLVPAYPEGGGGAEAPRPRNGYTIDRLKDKLGTRELATAEVTFDGAQAVPIGPLDRGIPNLVEHVLVPSRFACVIAAAAFTRRAERVVSAYADFRTAFGSTLIDFPLVRVAVDGIGTARRRATAAVFELLRLWEAARGGTEVEALDFRVMLSLCKPVLTQAATRGLHESMMLLGGNGIEERFSPLPRLYRDSVIMETWEGPHNVLLTQALRDLARFEVDPGAFVDRVAGDAGTRLGAELGELLSRASEPETTVPFAGFAERLVHAFADRVLAEIG
ncbi:MAG: acyl-CoA dehydrogenase, partial [Gammaproteobacteria bacterium]|nr:acyl-CoA dehydrogenase [Gemmatimonadota bacterium]NIU77877.1 acyl-CoA dehydrogenase [Gammaproteobacteria bacterium]